MAVPIASEAMAAEVLSSVIKGCTDYLACREHEKTERERIGAVLEVALAQINADVEKYKIILNENHDAFISVCDKIGDVIKLPHANTELITTAMQVLQNLYYKHGDDNIQMLNSALSSGQSIDIWRLR